MSYFWKLAPVGSRISTERGGNASTFLNGFFGSYAWRLYDSGTSALASVLYAARSLKKTKRPEVIIPAYACPDLVSAAKFAGVTAKLVDLERSRPWMDLNRLEEALNDNTIAIVAVNFLGIPERIGKLSEMARTVGAIVVDDSAQAFPGRNEERFWEADVVVLSFGRGKPVSLLGGGAILYRNKEFSGSLPSVESSGESGRAPSSKLVAEISAYNLLIQPSMYWMTNLLPFLKLGETVFKPLPSIGRMSDWKKDILPANIREYQQRLRPDSRPLIEKLVGELARDGLVKVDLPSACGLRSGRGLLRYPILVDQQCKRKLLGKADMRKLGCTELYGDTLPNIKGIGKELDGDLVTDRAAAFASELMTIPSHGLVTARDLSNIEANFRSLAD